MHCVSNKAPQCLGASEDTRSVRDEPRRSRDTDDVARAVAMKHADSHLSCVSDSTSDVEAAVFGSISESPETRLTMSVPVYGHMYSNL